MSRYFLVLAVILVGLYTLVFLTGDKKPHPRLGLDLRGGTSMTLSASNQLGKAPTAQSLGQARQIIANRVNATGVTEAEVVTEGNNNIVVNVARGITEDKLKQLVAPAQLNFREVKSQLSDHPVSTSSPSPSASGSAKPSGSASAKASATPSAKASPSRSAKASTSPSAKASASASASPAASLNPSQSAAAADAAKRLAAVQQKLGSTYAIAGQYISAVQQGQVDPSNPDANTISLLRPFADLSPDEVAVLPPQLQFYLPTVECSQLNARQPGSISDPAQQVIACGTAAGGDADRKYLLDVAKVTGTDVKSATSGFDTNQGGWIVTLKFTSKGGSRWTSLTDQAMKDGSGSSSSSSSSSGGAQVAIVLDNTVVSAPQIQQVIVGDAVINGGGINEQSSGILATQLNYGSLPLSFSIQSVDSVSPTLGSQQLEYGLLAGAIGLILVVAYCLFYYRALGLVVIASLVVSAALVFGSLVVLGRIMGFTLSLAGIAGFIVAIGITADSFVVFFERLKDEAKEGRTMRSSVPRAWVRARRTILSADAVSFLAAAILYWLAAGAVKGFAFTLGLSTILDLLIVFLFTHPLVALLSRSNTFSSPRVSGLGALRAAKAGPAGGTRFGTVRTKES
ncbi:MAG TPA: protein translocase subunit SecD [Rugosimonospora sp.]|nr:protein translocase subunit SecD [Rugosimonospora sp.]